ncbi:MAG: LptF/LptG family permease [Desulfotalea sp.]
MTLLDKYLLKQFFKFLLTIGSGFVALYLLIDFFEKFDNFSEAGKPLSLAFEYFLLSVPFVLDQLGPIMILLSGVVTLGLLNHSNELTALKAGGLPLRKIIVPLIGGGIITTTLLLASAQWILPITVTRTNEIWLEGVKGEEPKGIIRNGKYFYRGVSGIYSFSWPDTKENSFKEFSYSRWNGNFEIDEVITAEKADWLATENNWILYNTIIQQKTGDLQVPYNVTTFAKTKMSFPEQPDIFRTPVNQKAESSLTELTELYLETTIAHDKRTILLTILSRLSYIFLGLPLLILGLPILLISYQRWGKDLSIAIPASCFLAFTAWAIWGTLQSLAITGSVSPWLSASVIHLIFASIGLYMLRQFDK